MVARFGAAERAMLPPASRRLQLADAAASGNPWAIWVGVGAAEPANGWGQGVAAGGGGADALREGPPSEGPSMSEHGRSQICCGLGPRGHGDIISLFMAQDLAQRGMDKTNPSNKRQDKAPPVGKARQGNTIQDHAIHSHSGAEY